MKFEYKKFPTPPNHALPQRHFSSRPVIPVVIKNPDNGRAIGYEALIDSGADFNILPAEIGEIIGLDIMKGNLINFSGIGSSGHVAYFHKVKISIGGIEHELDCGFSYDIVKNGYGILGQKGFFDHFIVKFDYSKKEIEIKNKS